MESILLLPMEKGAFYGIKNDWADKKVRLQNRRRQFEYYPDQWCLRLAGRKRRRKNNAYAAALQYPKHRCTRGTNKIK